MFSFVMNCILVDCGELSHPTNGQVTILRFIATYKCDLGYTLVGDDSQTCLINGAWSDSPPLCQGIHIMLELPQMLLLWLVLILCSS